MARNIRAGCIVFSLMFWLQDGLTYAETVEQKLQPSKSSIEIEISSPQVTLDGSIGRFSGDLKLNLSDLTKSNVVFILYPNSSSLRSEDGMMDFTPMLEKTPQTPVRFESSTITQTGKNSYAIEGTALYGKRKELVQIPVRVIKIGKEESEFTITMNGTSGDPSLALPIPIPVSNAKVTVHAKLIFQVQGNSAGKDKPIPKKEN